ncbi:MAG: exo-alpha-sialidase [Anaerolineae bacterium]|nr:exo-alpha-sialidase [Anaerolineae bacterium]
MTKPAVLRSIVALLLGLTIVSLARGSAPDYVGPIYSGAELDYQPAIIRVSPGGDLMVVFERLAPGSYFGDLYVSFSSDGGHTWTTPQAIVSSALNERHPALVQLASDSFALFYLVDETSSGGYRLHRATSADGLVWTDQGALDLGWATPGEINPCVIREADGTLTMTYHRLSGPSYIARSADGGATWDKAKTQVSSGSAALPRLAKRESDGLYLVTYQVNPGGNNLDIYSKTSTDPYDWSGPQHPLSTAINSHDSQPVVLEDGAFLVTYASTPVSYFDLFYRTSRDGVVWSDGVQVTNDPAHYDTQPHPLLAGAPGYVLLTWSHQVGATPYVDHDVWINTGLAIPPDLSGSAKAVDPPIFYPSDLLTYTLVLSNTGLGPTVAWLADPIPADTAYQPGSLWASSGQYGYDPAGDTITWTGMISAGGQVTLSFQVSTGLDLSDGDVVTNTAWLTDGQGIACTLTAAAAAIPLWRFYLPVVIKE